jgi:hypothetical protein
MAEWEANLSSGRMLTETGVTGEFTHNSHSVLTTASLPFPRLTMLKKLSRNLRVSTSTVSR